MSRTQFRAKSAVPAVIEDGVEWEEIESAGFDGSVQIKALEARSESWFWLPVCDGTAGLDCELGEDFAAQQGILPPCWQHARIGCWAHDEGVCASRNGVPASTKPQMMANANFIVKTVTLLGLPR